MQAIKKLVVAAIALCISLQVSAGWAQPAEKRIGLVIGNAAYQTGALATAANDAGLVAQTLQAAGFDVVGARDLDEESLRHAVRDFIEKATAAGPDAVAFVYFAGYGVQLEGENYLVPIDAKIDRDSDVPVRGLRVYDFVVRTLASLKPKASFVVLDAARANPFARSGQPLAGGLALIEPPPGMLIAFNAAPGTIAPEAQGPYGPYAQALAEMMREGGLPVGDMFDRIRLRVNEITKGAEVPWSASNALPPFVFFERAADAPPPSAPPEQVSAMRSRPIRDLGPQEGYVAALNRDTVGAYEEFVDTYPDDPLARRARAILAVRREAIVWHRTCVADTPNAYWSYLKRYAEGPHAFDARRRLARLAAALEPPSVFQAFAFDVSPPPPEEIVYVGRPVLAFDDPFFALPPPPPPPIFLLPPPPPEFILLPPPPPPVGLFVLPAPVFLPVPVWVHPPVYVAPPPPNNVIFSNIHNTVVINQTTNTVSVTTPSGQPVAPTVQPSAPLAAPQAGAAGQSAAPQNVAATPIGPSLPPSVAQKAALTLAAPGAGGTLPVPGQAQPGAGPAPTAPPQSALQPGPGAKPPIGQPLPGAGGQPLPSSASAVPGQPGQAGPHQAPNAKPGVGQPLPGAGGQPLPSSASAVPGQPGQAGPHQAPNAKPGVGQPLPGAGGQPVPSSASAVPGQPSQGNPASPNTHPAGPGAPHSVQTPPGAALPKSNKNLAVTPPPSQRQPPSLQPPSRVAPPPRMAPPPPQAMRPPTPPPPPPQAMRPAPPPIVHAAPGPAPQAGRPAVAPACPPGLHFANGKCVK